MQSIATSWIWADAVSGGVKGARIDIAAGYIEWVDQPGCACGDAVARQNIADFLANDPLESPPPDVLEEMRVAVNKALSIDRRHWRR